MVKICQTYVRSKTSEHSSNQPSDRLQRGPIRSRCGAAALALFLLSCLTAGACQAQSRDVVCHEGAGDFAAEFHTGVRVRVGPSRNGELESRSCEATLSWGD